MTVKQGFVRWVSCYALALCIGSCEQVKWLEFSVGFVSKLLEHHALVNDKQRYSVIVKSSDARMFVVGLWPRSLTPDDVSFKRPCI